MQIQINGEIRAITNGITLQKLIENLGIHPETIAVELNELVVPRKKLAETIMKEGDRIEIVRMVGGGGMPDRP